MERTYLIGRNQASMAMARKASSSEARLVHLELAGRYSVQAASVSPSPPAAEVYYAQLEQGARFLASRTSAEAERDLHLGMANRYARRGLVAPTRRKKNG